ncbi:MAG: hypothetical protein D3916_13420 [Candidatus Electrothrix sp. MAN1_4]|nr:hypothetical protein [Candidatus Electrothrix sp. MAN1_4]
MATFTSVFDGFWTKLVQFFYQWFVRFFESGSLFMSLFYAALAVFAAEFLPTVFFSLLSWSLEYLLSTVPDAHWEKAMSISLDLPGLDYFAYSASVFGLFECLNILISFLFIRFVISLIPFI